MNQLIDEDPVVVQETMVFVEKVAKKENFLNAMIRNIDFVGAIIQSLVIAMNNLNEGVNALAVANNANESGNVFGIMAMATIFYLSISFNFLFSFLAKI